MPVAIKVVLNAGIPTIMQMLTEQFRIVAAHGIGADRMAALMLE